MKANTFVTFSRVLHYTYAESIIPIEMYTYRHLTTYSLVLAMALLMPLTDLYAQTKPADADVSFHVSKTQKCSKSRQTDLDMAKLKGLVKKTVTEIYSLQRPDDITATPELSTISTMEFNRAGRWMYMRSEPKSSQKTKIICGATIYQRLFDATGNITVETEFCADSSFGSLLRYEYSSTGKPVLARIHNYMRVDTNVEEHNGMKKYDEWGNCIEDSYSLTKFLYKYDEFGNCIENIWITCYPYQIDSARDTTTTKTIYDDNCRPVEANTISRSAVAGIKVAKTIYKYDTEGRLLEAKLEDLTNSRSESILYKYDDKGNELRRDESEPGKKTIVTHSYIFDTHGNWVEATEYRNSRLYTRQKRKITYY